MMSSKVLALILGLAFAGCQSDPMFDRGRLNHPAMDTSYHPTSPAKGLLTRLDSVTGNNQSGACGVCAK